MTAVRGEAEASRGGTDEGTPETMRFEEVMERLEALVARLERGELGLEESLALYEEGVALARRAQRQLEAVEGKIEALLADGSVTPLELEAGPAAEGAGA